MWKHTGCECHVWKLSLAQTHTQFFFLVNFVKSHVSSIEHMISPRDYDCTDNQKVKNTEHPGQKSKPDPIHSQKSLNSEIRKQKVEQPRINLVCEEKQRFFQEAGESMSLSLGFFYVWTDFILSQFGASWLCSDLSCVFLCVHTQWWMTVHWLCAVTIAKQGTAQFSNTNTAFRVPCSPIHRPQTSAEVWMVFRSGTQCVWWSPGHLDNTLSEG